jgi:hypothetical protein
VVGLLKPFKGRGNPLLTPYAVMGQVKRFPFILFLTSVWWLVF